MFWICSEKALNLTLKKLWISFLLEWGKLAKAYSRSHCLIGQLLANSVCQNIPQHTNLVIHNQSQRSRMFWFYSHLTLLASRMKSLHCHLPLLNKQMSRLRSRPPTECIYKDGLPSIIHSFFIIAFNSNRSIIVYCLNHLFGILVPH
jgi:hypothetical protein